MSADAHASGNTRSYIWDIQMNVPVNSVITNKIASCKACHEAQRTSADSHCSACKAVIIDSLRIVLTNRLETSSDKPASISYVSAQYIPFIHDLNLPSILVHILVQCKQTGISPIRHWVGKEAEIRPISGSFQTCEAYLLFSDRKKGIDWVSITFGSINKGGRKPGKRPALSAASQNSTQTPFARCQTSQATSKVK